ncbi:MAG: PD-(D/E)XK nuclease family protein [Acidobacteria bacterium]|nr:PD-(D/E)XK nuclease family protein [Acidobacteriota bacterium]
MSELPERPSGPRAEFGRLAHTLTELAVSGRLGSNCIPGDAAEAFDHLLAKTALLLSRSEDTRRYADLRVAFTKWEWEKRRYLAVTAAEEAVKRRPLADRANSARHRPAPLTLARFLERKLQTAAEVPFESSTLRIRGRLDLVDRETLRDVRISDLKSGRVADSDGGLNEETALQLRLYGLAALELAPDRRVSLRVLSRDGESFASFGDAEIQATSQWLGVITSRLPAGMHVEAEDIAVIGRQCKGCELRPVCPAYRNAVSALWKSPANPWELPLDTAGTVLAREKRYSKYVTLKIADLAGRTVKIHQMYSETVCTSAPPQTLWFFDLASIEARMHKTGWRHPQNFHEVAMTPHEITAWTLRVFVDAAQG